MSGELIFLPTSHASDPIPASRNGLSQSGGPTLIITINSDGTTM